MEYMADEMLEGLPEVLKDAGIDCKTVFEWIDGAKQKKRKIEDWEIRKFLAKRRSEGEEIALITNDYDNWKQVEADNLPVIYVPLLIRDCLIKREGSGKGL
jgi:hypothetical protein